MAYGLLADASDDISSDAKDIAASLFDFICDAGEIMNEISFSERLQFAREMGTMLSDLEALGAIAYAGRRATKLSNSAWANPQPLQVNIICITIVPADRDLKGNPGSSPNHHVTDLFGTHKTPTRVGQTPALARLQSGQTAPGPILVIDGISSVAAMTGR